MNTYAVYFKPLGALATWPLGSDTLFGAVCWGIRTLGLMDDEQLTNWLETQKTAPVFAFSHAFPVYKKEGDWLRLYPRPATFQPSFDDFNVLAEEWKKNESGKTLKAAKVDVAAAGKKFKRQDYVTEAALHQIASGDLKPIDGLRAMLKLLNTKQTPPKILCIEAERKSLPQKFFEREAMQHNQIDRMSGATVEGMLFYRDETFFPSGASLWALLQANEEDMTRYIQPALNYLADTGLGADRTSGKGQFEIIVKSAPVLPRAKTPKAMMTLSYYLPSASELDLHSEPLAYSIKTLRPKREQKYPRHLPEGQKSVPIYKQAIRFFEPGSVFPLKNQQEVYGRLARLTPVGQEAVYQSGAALMIYL